MAFNKRDYKYPVLVSNTWLNKNRDEIWYNNFTLNYSIPFKIKGWTHNCNHSGFIDEDGNPSATYLIAPENINDISTWILPPGKYDEGEIGFVYGRGNERTKFDDGTYGPNYFVSSYLTYKNGHVYNIYNEYNDDPEPLNRPDIKHLTRIYPVPENEMVYKAVLYRLNVYYITQKGNVYVISNSSNITNYNSYIKTKITDAVEIKPKHDVFGIKGYSYIFNGDGSLSYMYGGLKTGNAPTKITGLPRIKAMNKSRNYDHSDLITVWGEDGKFYTIYKDEVINIQEFPDETIIDYCEWNNGFMVLTDTNILHRFEVKIITDSDNGEVNISVIPYSRNYDILLEDIATAGEYDKPPIPYVNLDIDYYTYTYQSTQTNVTYKYRFKLNQNISNDSLRNVVNYVPNCGLHLYDKVI